MPLSHSKTLRFLMVILFSLFAITSFANGGGGGEAKDDGKPKYVEIKPALVTNFLSDRVRFVKVDVAIKVKDDAHSKLIQVHIPLIKHHLLMLLSNQQEDALVTPEGQINLKAQALDVLTSVLEEEIGSSPEIIEVLFTGFLVE